MSSVLSTPAHVYFNADADDNMQKHQSSKGVMDETSLHTTLDVSTRKTTDVRVKYEKDLAAYEHQRAEQHAVFLPPHLLELMHSTESW